jgi:hypothetical protein
VKAKMVLQLVFREPAEILHATSTPVCSPHRFLTLQIHADYVLHDCPTGTNVVNLFSARSRYTRSSRGKLVSTVAAWGQLSKPWARGSFDVSDGHLIKAGYIQSLARGRSSNDEAQAWGCEWKKAGRFLCRPSFAGLAKRMDEAVVCGRKRRTEYQTRDAVRDQSQESKEMSWILRATGR